MDMFLQRAYHTQIRPRVSHQFMQVCLFVCLQAFFWQDFCMIDRQIRGYWSSIIFLIPLFQVFQAQTPENVKGIIRFDLILKSLLVSQWLQIIQSWPQHKGIYFLLSIMIVSQVYFLFMYLTKDSYSCAKHNYVDKGLV